MGEGGGDVDEQACSRCARHRNPGRHLPAIGNDGHRKRDRERRSTAARRIEHELTVHRPCEFTAEAETEPQSDAGGKPRFEDVGGRVDRNARAVIADGQAGGLIAHGDADLDGADRRVALDVLHEVGDDLQVEIGVCHHPGAFRNGEVRAAPDVDVAGEGTLDDRAHRGRRDGRVERRPLKARKRQEVADEMLHLIGFGAGERQEFRPLCFVQRHARIEHHVEHPDHRGERGPKLVRDA